MSDITKSYVIRDIDDELNAMQIISMCMENLSTDEKLRVLAYFKDKAMCEKQS